MCLASVFCENGDMYLSIKIIHVVCATLSISGFILRGYWMMEKSSMLARRVTKIAPHVVDTVFLLSGIAMLWMTSLNPFTQAWLLAKFIGLVGYIFLGLIALDRGPTPQIRVIAFVGAVSLYAYIIGVAMTRSIASWLAYFLG